MLGLARGLLSGAIVSGTPLLYATLGELISERAGIVNLGLEGVMLVGAVVGFITCVSTGSATLAVTAAALAGALFNMIFAFLVISRRANPLASGLALMFCGVGLSALLGAPYIGSQIGGLPEISIPGLADLPLLGPALFAHDALVYLAAPVATLLWWVLFFTRWGLSLRAVGENPVAAFAAGRNPHRIQYQALVVAGILGMSLLGVVAWRSRDALVRLGPGLDRLEGQEGQPGQPVGGTQPGERVHPVVVEAMREDGIDLDGVVPQKLTEDLTRQVQVLVTMGCGDACPFVPGARVEDWPLLDPKGQPLAIVRQIRDDIRAKVEDLIARTPDLD